MKRGTRNFPSAAALAVLATGASLAHAADGKWTYAGATGPAKWNKLDKSYEVCADGNQQSPIDIPDAKVRKGDFPSLLFNYKPGAVTFETNPHMMMATIAEGAYVSLDASTYFLNGIRIHRPAEHKVDGKLAEAEVQLLHKTKEGKTGILVVGLKTGKENPVLRALIAGAPAATPKPGTLSGPTVALADLLPANKDYYGYTGSLSTPPCTEGVEWIVLKNPVTASADQLSRLSKLYPANARPTQPLNGRDVRGSR